MQIPEDFNYGDLTKENKEFLCTLINEIEEDGYFSIYKLHKFSNCDVAYVNIRGKDPLLSTMKKCAVDTMLLKYIMQIVDGHVSYNFTIRDGELYLPKNIETERFDITAPNDIQDITSIIQYTSQTPVEVIWRMAKLGYSFIWPKCAAVPCYKIYLGYDNFSIKVDYVDEKGEKATFTVMELVDGRYVYGDVYVVQASILNIEPDMLIDTAIQVPIEDDLGRIRIARRVNLALYEKNMFNNNRFSKVYEKDFTLTILNRMYSMASYLNGLNMILKDMGVDCQSFALPYRKQEVFVLDTDKQHNTFTFQTIWYDIKIMSDVKRVYIENKDLIRDYIRTKEDGTRENLYRIFEENCDSTYGPLLHYFVNGVLDALAIQKGDKRTRSEILSGYVGTVHKEFIMYACYFYDLRTAFLRNNFRIKREFDSTLIINNYNGCYFRVG